MLPEQPTFHYMVNCTNPRLEDLITICKRVLIARYIDEEYKSIGEILKKRSKLLRGMHSSSTKGVVSGGPTPIQPYASKYGQKYAGAYTAYQPPALLPHPGDLAYQAPPGYQLVPQQAHSSMYVSSTTPSSLYSGAYKGTPYSGQGGGKKPPNEGELRKRGFEHACNTKILRRANKLITLHHKKVMGCHIDHIKVIIRKILSHNKWLNSHLILMNQDQKLKVFKMF
jgi:hypothetical protein